MRFLRAFIAAVLLSVLGYLLFLAAAVEYPPIRLFGVLTQLLGVPRIFQLVHSVFGLGQGGKIFAFTGVALLWLGGITVVGGLLRPLMTGALLAILGLLFLPWPLSIGYGLGLWLLLEGVNRLLAPRPGAPADVSPARVNRARRGATGWLAGLGALVAAGGLTALFRSTGAAAQASATAPVTPGDLPSGVTPVSEWYYVSKNLEAFDPNIKAAGWQLKVDGLAQTPRSYSLDDLKKFPPVTQELTLSCISNPVGGPLISNGIWQGFRLADLLRDVGMQSGARYLLWTSADGYTESLPLGQALERDVLLVTQLNGQPLTPKHGFPLRVLIPNRYGMKQPRWITGITLSAEDRPGYWVQRGWSKTAFVELTSIIQSPSYDKPTVKAGAPTRVTGVAFWGDRPITKVELSLDGQQTWQEVKLEPPRTKYAWTRWSSPWTPAEGSHQLAVRAYSGDTVQVKKDKDALPEGATGYDNFIVTASA